MLKKSKNKIDEKTIEELAELQRRTATRLGDLISKTPKQEFQSLDAIDTRARQRKQAEHKATAFLDDDHDVACKIVDVSLDGFKVALENEEYFPDTVILECSPLGGFIVGEVRWQTGREAGLQIDRAWTKKLRLAAAPKSAA